MDLRRLSILVAKNIKRCRVKAALTQEEAAESAKMHYKFYQRLENTTGRCRATMPTLARLGSVFKVHPVEFFRPVRIRKKVTEG